MKSSWKIIIGQQIKTVLSVEQLRIQLDHRLNLNTVFPLISAGLQISTAF